MTTMELLQEFSCSTDQIIIKRKRTKRPRPSPSTSSSGVCLLNVIANGKGEEFRNTISVSSPTASSTGPSTTTEEDEEDMAANCLILLASGGRMEDKEVKHATKTNTSRKFTEMPTTTVGKVGIYVYECKTCNRAFSSFQALGGHRASHKKPKLTVDIVDTCKVTPQQPNKVTKHQENKEAKVHECAICGSEFGSGQALGGHMRRHRSAIVASTNNKMNIGGVSNIDHPESLSHDASENAGNVLVLDLNLPAETEEGDDRSDDKYYQSSDGQPRRVFSATVDYQY